ncbi:MAG: YkgJ family cysteine cluster protein [Candidatus Eremiobacterota bacterium]
MKKIFLKLDEIYKKLQEKFINKTAGSCTGCNYCCNSDINYPPISSLEYDFLESHLAEEERDKIDTFKSFMKEKDRPACPFYSSGCRVYKFRPLCCRLFGTFISINTVLPDTCIYKNIAQRTDEKTLFRIEPSLREFQILKIAYDIEKSKESEKKKILMIKLAEEYIAQNLLHEALETLEEINKSYPHEPAFYFYSGLINKWLGNIDTSVSCLEKAIELKGEKKYPSVYEYLGMIYYSMNKLDKAREMLKKGINVLPDSKEAYLGLTMVNLKEGALYCSKILDLEPENTVALHILNNSYLREFL